jgi:hypothetical protein
MKTINVFVNVFNTLQGAESFYANQRTARLLKVKQPTGKKNFFVDVTPVQAEHIHVVWPNKYDILRDKVNEREFKRQA